MRTWPTPLQVSQVDGLRARRGAAALAGLAFAERREFDLGVVAEHGLLEIELQVVAQIGAAKHLPPAAPTAAEDVAEHVAEDVAERVAALNPPPPPRAASPS